MTLFWDEQQILDLAVNPEMANAAYIFGFLDRFSFNHF